MWFLVLPLAVGVLPAGVPVSTTGTGAAVAVCFSPEEDCTALAVDAIDRAETQILVNAHGLTTSSSTVEALIRAKQRGVDVRLIADRTTPCCHNSGIGLLARAGIPIWIDHSAPIAHSKSIIIDGTATLSVRRAARIGDAWLIVNTNGLGKVTALMQTYRAALKKYGRTPMKLPITVECYVGTRHATAHEECRGPLEYKYNAYASWGLENRTRKVRSRISRATGSS